MIRTTNYTPESCYRRNKNESPEIQLIFAIREKFPNARLSGAQRGMEFLWRIVDGPLADMAFVPTIEEAWSKCYCAASGIEWHQGMVDQLRGKR